MYLEHGEVLVLNVRFHYHDLEQSKIRLIVLEYIHDHCFEFLLAVLLLLFI